MKVLVEFDLSNPKDKYLFDHVCAMRDIDTNVPVEELPKKKQENLTINCALTGEEHPFDGRMIMEDAQ